MPADQCSKIDKVGRATVVCHLPLHHSAVIVNGRPAIVHKGLINGGKLHEWEDDDDLPAM